MTDQNPNHVMVQIEEMLVKAKPLLTSNCYIHMVPHEIRKLNSDAYTPKVVSIGPIHYGFSRLQTMESQKLVCCKKFLQRAETSLDNLVRCVQDLEPQVRQSYSININFGADEFVKMIFVDCTFIIEFFLADYECTHDDIAVPLKLRLKAFITLDLLLLENQIPFFVLEKLYNLAFPSRVNDNTYPSFVDLALHCFRRFKVQDVAPSGAVKHFTDLLRVFYLPPLENLPGRDVFPTQFYSVTELTDAGVKFRINKQGHLLKLKFSGCYLEIPKFQVHDATEIIFRNMIALEQCHYPTKSYITDYALFLDFLINTSRDVDVLVQKGIIKNWLSDSYAVAKLVNGLCKCTVNANFNSEYSDICKRLDVYCKLPWNRRRTALRRDYCKTPWQMVTSLAAILLLILTVIQTLCSILQVSKA